MLLPGTNGYRLLMLIVWVSAAVSGWSFAQDEKNFSEIPQRPFGHILDEARWFTLKERELAIKELGRLFTENQVDVYIVTSPTQPPQGAQTYARKIGESWARTPVWCVVFHVPGDPSGFHIEAGGVEIEREKILQVVEEASRRARRENSEKDRVMAAWQECSEGLRFIHASGKRYNERVVEVKREIRSDFARKKKWKKVILVAAGLGLVVLVVVICLLVKFSRRTKFPYHFPETAWRLRFQSPHSGGGGIVVNYRRKKLK